MVPQSYYDMLALSNSAGLAEVKKAYRLVAKRNHPDLFPEKERLVRLARMTSINEAYRVIVKDLRIKEIKTSAKSGQSSTATNTTRRTGDPAGASSEREAASRSEPNDAQAPGTGTAWTDQGTSYSGSTPGGEGSQEAYFWGAAYSAPSFDPLAPALPKDPGYVYYKRGYVLFSQGRRALLQRYNGRRLDFTNLTADVLKLAVTSLGFFHKAHENFRHVVEQHPDSIWARDSEVKMYFLRRYDVIYRRICENMRRQLKPTNH